MGHPGFPKQIAYKDMWSLLVQQKNAWGGPNMYVYTLKNACSLVRLDPISAAAQLHWSVQCSLMCTIIPGKRGIDLHYFHSVKCSNYYIVLNIWQGIKECKSGAMCYTVIT